MKRYIERFYSWLFSDDEEISFKHKAFIFYFSLMSFLFVLFLIARDIYKVNMTPD
ncbi:MAG: hypothetical protein AAFX87_16335 [Bacteroidota bacterium]